MKLTKKTKLILIIIPIIACITLIGFVFAQNNNLGRVVTRERTSIILKQQEEDPKKIDVYLGMADTSSIVNFQIGLNVDVGSNFNTTFEWSDELNKEKEEFKDYTINEKKDTQTGGDIERINIYYVGTEELNELSVDESGKDINVDNIKVGTINLEYVKDEKGNPINQASSSLLIQPVGTDDDNSTNTDEDFTKTVSVSHVATSVKVLNEDILRTTTDGPIISSGDDEGEEGTGNQEGQQGQQEENGNQGEQTGETGNQGGSTGGSGSNSGSGSTNNQKPQEQSLLGRLFSPTKTGENRSNIWIICTLAVLIILAIAIILIKNRKGKGKRH